ncbi:MAG TPA: hypothetical protein VIV60_36650 [Polyangiaceae bacterium]
MNPAIAIQIIQALIAGIPAVADGIKKIIGDVAEANGLDPIQLAKEIVGDGHEAVDQTVDAIIDARWPQS